MEKGHFQAMNEREDVLEDIHEKFVKLDVEASQLKEDNFHL